MGSGGGGLAELLVAGQRTVVGWVGIFLCFGFFTLQPNESRVLVLFGSYRGTVRTSNWHWTNPLNSKLRLSLRSRNFTSEKLKVNDKRGNPIGIAVVVVWRVQDTAQASFDVERFSEYVEVQSESAVRHLANCYPYDHGEENETTSRTGRGTQGNDGEQPVDRTLRRSGGPSGNQYGHDLPLSEDHEVPQGICVTHRP